jgi:hypothetical protein
LRALRDRIEVTTAAGRRASPDGIPLATLSERYGALRAAVAPGVAAIDSSALSGEDRRALATMRAALQADLGPLTALDAGGGEPRSPDCDYHSRTIPTTADGADSLRRLAYACFGWAQQHLRVDGEQLDRITLLGMLGRTDHPERRRRLFLALEPVWRSVDGDGGPSSPYRLLLLNGRRPASSVADRARGLGLESDSLEHWLVEILEAWRAGTPDSLVEPWDWHYLNGRASQVLDPRIPRDRMDSLAAQVFRALGADPAALHVHYDLAPREGKTPVAYTTFGARAREVDGTWVPAEPWVFATYLTGGLGYLDELLHETGHAVHIAAIRTRPAFLDWPDSDPFSEALGDFVALDVYEPVWQMRWLGDSVPLADGLRARYAGVVLDVAWALFELELQRSPTADHPGLSPDPTAPRARLVGHAGPAAGRAGLHDELRRRGHRHCRDPGPHRGAAWPFRHRRLHLVRLGGAAALPLRAGAQLTSGHHRFSRRAGHAGGAARGHGPDAPLTPGRGQRRDAV